MSKDTEITPVEVGIVIEQEDAQKAEVLDDDFEVGTGQWYWIDENNENESTWFACVVEMGSNYVKMETPGGSTTRIHFDTFDQRCRLEPDPDGYIDGRIHHYQEKRADG